MKLSKNKNFKEEYCASVVKIGEIQPIEGKDRIVKTLVNGLTIVIGKQDFKEGDIAVYVSNECVIHELFLHLNSMYEDKELNADKEQRGYINSKGRVRVVKLGGVPSYGILLTPAAIARFLNDTEDNVRQFLAKHVGEDFDEINGERFCHVYVPYQRPHNEGSKADKKAKKIARFKMLIEGSFRLHYDTKQLEKNIRSIRPEDKVSISVKIHGTSAVFANILTNMPTPWLKRMWRKYVSHRPEYDTAYNLVYSSRTVVKNEFINPGQRPGGFYSDDVWGYWAEKLAPVLPKDMCIYCEIVGFTPNGSAIQKGYDYGAPANGEQRSRLFVYRATQGNRECEMDEVVAINEKLESIFGNEILPFPMLHYGTLTKLYPDIPVDEHWHDRILEALKHEPRFGMEKNEPLCHNKVPREGFVLRIIGNPIAEAWKLKCDAFRMREAKLVDAGEVDAEMAETYAEA